MNNKEIAELFNNLLELSTNTYYRTNPIINKVFLVLTINGGKVYLYSSPFEVLTHSKKSNAFISDYLKREPDERRNNGNVEQIVHVFKLS